MPASSFFPSIPAGVNLMGPMAVCQGWPFNTWFDPFQRVLYQSGLLQKAAMQSNDTLQIIRTHQQLTRFLNDRKNNSTLVGALLGCAGLEVLQGERERVRILYHAGYRFLAPAYLTPNAVCSTALDKNDAGLTPFGEEVVRFAEKLKLTLDLTHASSKTVDDVLAISTRPVLLCLYTRDNPPCLSDTQLRAIADGGGLIGIGFNVSDMATVVSTLRHAADVVGADHVALGGGFDEGLAMPIEVTGVAGLAPLLHDAGFTRGEIQGILGENIRQFLLNNLPSDTDGHNVS